jgi:hypothetical protein
MVVPVAIDGEPTPGTTLPASSVRAVAVSDAATVRVRDPSGSDVLVERLASLGIHVDQPADLLNGATSTTGFAIPLLLESLEKSTDPRFEEWMVRALTVSWAKPAAARPLVGPDRGDQGAGGARRVHRRSRARLTG